jgi:hypothetical protein
VKRGKTAIKPLTTLNQLKTNKNASGPSLGAKEGAPTLGQFADALLLKLGQKVGL